MFWHLSFLAKVSNALLDSKSILAHVVLVPATEHRFSYVRTHVASSRLLGTSRGTLHAKAPRMGILPYPASQTGGVELIAMTVAAEWSTSTCENQRLIYET